MKRVAFFLTFFWACIASAGATPAIRVTNAWSRPAIDMGVVYVRIANHGATPDRLIGAASPIAHAVELHESMESKPGGVAMGGVATMHPVHSITVPARGSVRFAPGGYHIMLIGLVHDLHAGQRFPIRLHFVRSGWIATTVTVRPI